MMLLFLIGNGLLFKMKKSIKDGSVSVAMTTYNGELFIDQQLKSILNQTYTLDEIIICDDCSTDKTVERIQSFISIYPDKIKLHINIKNIGYVKNFEQCARMCNSEFIAFSDQDDIWEPNKIKYLMNAIGNNYIVHSDALLIDKNGKILSKSFSHEYKKSIKQSFLGLLFKSAITGCTMIIKKDILKNISFFPKELPHDYFLSIIGASRGINYVNKSLIRYRQHENNVIGFDFNKKSKQIINLQLILKDLILIKRRRSQLLISLEDRIQYIYPIIEPHLQKNDYETLRNFKVFISKSKQVKVIDFDFMFHYLMYFKHFPNKNLINYYWLFTSWLNII